ncbi:MULTISPECIES: hypothetical protein [unclassified Nocardia]|uniref:hypothetical protein n=1 Tax=unclassified Nocardia TaxID=2637762 RepID=UPI001CE408D1|nr:MULTISPECIES: hypothetical protein [unclassified Nocardia]
MTDVRTSKHDSITQSSPSDQVWRGVASLLDQYICLKDTDSVLLLYARDAREPTAWVAAELSARGITPALIDLNSISASDMNSGPLTTGFMDKLSKASIRPDSIRDRLVVVVIEYDTITPSEWIRAALAPLPSAQVVAFRTIMAGREFFEQGVTVSPATLNNINAGLLNKLRSAERFRIKSSSGTDLEVTLDPTRYRWVSNRGIPREKAFVFLPAGEVATYPAHISGVLVADGAFNSTAYTKLDARLRDHPVVTEIEDGRAVNYSCESDPVRKLIERCLSLPNADRVGELGFGTNIGIEHFIPLNSHLNERYPGVHIGFGQNNQGKHVLYECDVHLDLILADCTIEIPGESPLLSSDFKDLGGEHPAIETGVYDEDIDGDCCGLFSAYNPRQCQ